MAFLFPGENPGEAIQDPGGDYEVNRFTRSQWDEFMEQGFLMIEDALAGEEVERYLKMIDECCAEDNRYDPTEFFGSRNIVERYPVFSELIDHPRHVGFARLTHSWTIPLPTSLRGLCELSGSLC